MLATLCFVSILFLTQLPSTDHKVLTGEESSSLDAKLEHLETKRETLEQKLQRAESPESVAKLEKELESTAMQVHDLTTHTDPLFLQHFPAYLERLDMLEGLYSAEHPLTPDLAEVLADEFYIDQGHPSINYRMHIAVITNMCGAASNPAVSQGTIDVIRDRLVRYYDEGGGISSPIMETELASLLFRVSDSKDSIAQSIVTTLCDDAESWAHQLGRHAEWEHNFIRIRNNIAATNELSRIQEVLLEPASNPQPAQLVTNQGEKVDTKQARREFELLIKRFNWDVSKLDRVYVIATATYHDKALQREFMQRLLTSYYRILKATEIPMFVKKRIEANLIEIAKGDRLDSERLWQLWAKTTIAVDNAGSELKKYVQSTDIETKSAVVSKPMVRRAFEMVRRRLCEKSRA